MSWPDPRTDTKPKPCDMCLRELSVAPPCWAAKGCDHTTNTCACGVIYCGHTYCKDCVLQLYEFGFKCEAYFPPRCCGRPLNGSSLLWSAIAAKGAQYDAKYFQDMHSSKTREYGYRKRVYCAGCESIVHFQTITGFGTCACGGAKNKKTCILCGQGVGVKNRQCDNCAEELGDLGDKEALFEELPQFQTPAEFKQSFIKRGFLPCFNCCLKIPASKIHGEAECKCGVKTCIRCLRDVSASPYQDHTKCAMDSDHQKVLRYARELGLDVRMCKTCGRILERVGTCRELPCPCGSVFCYNCSHKMASCVCTPELLNKQKQANANPERGHFCAHFNFVRLEPEDEGGPRACAFCFRRFADGVATAGEKGTSGPSREPVFECIGNNCKLKACRACARNLHGKLKGLVHARHAVSAQGNFEELTIVDDLVFDDFD